MLVVGPFTVHVAVLLTPALSDHFGLTGPAAPVFVAGLPALVLWFGTLGIELAVALSALPTACSAAPRPPGPSTVDTATPTARPAATSRGCRTSAAPRWSGSGSRHLARRQS